MVRAAPYCLMVNARAQSSRRCDPGLSVIVRIGNLAGGRSRGQLGGEDPAGETVGEADRIGIDHLRGRRGPVGPGGVYSASWTKAGEIHEQGFEVRLKVRHTSNAIRPI